MNYDILILSLSRQFKKLILLIIKNAHKLDNLRYFEHKKLDWSQITYDWSFFQINISSASRLGITDFLKRLRNKDKLHQIDTCETCPPLTCVAWYIVWTSNSWKWTLFTEWVTKLSQSIRTLGSSGKIDFTAHFWISCLLLKLSRIKFTDYSFISA